MTRSGNHYTFTNRDDNATVAVGGNVTFGFVASGWLTCHPRLGAVPPPPSAWRRRPGCDHGVTL
ncbi:MAG TPA: hypothetical protein VE776_03890 [Actinomycetota bacterium]|jgi:hypothetical protein|nr:hypothetical protein [Actinomycetota bacterium]